MGEGEEIAERLGLRSPTSDVLQDEEIVTQRISRGPGGRPNIDRPRAKEESVSLIRGRVSPSVAYHRVRRGGNPAGDDGARYASVGALRAHGFVVEHTPRPGNRLHVSARYQGEWDHVVTQLFVSCFKESAWHQMGGSHE